MKLALSLALSLLFHAALLALPIHLSKAIPQNEHLIPVVVINPGDDGGGLWTPARSVAPKRADKNRDGISSRRESEPPMSSPAADLSVDRPGLIDLDPALDSTGTVPAALGAKEAADSAILAGPEGARSGAGPVSPGSGGAGGGSEGNGGRNSSLPH